MLAVTLPDWLQPVIDFVRSHPHLIEVIVFTLGFAESIALVSLFIPSSALFIGIGAAQSAADGAFWPLWLAGAAGACLGDCVSYWLGWRYKDGVLKVWPVSSMPGLVTQARHLFHRWGGLSIVAGKFLGGLRPFLPVVAGMVDMPLRKFVLASGVSSLAWAGVFLAPGFGVRLFTG